MLNKMIVAMIVLALPAVRTLGQKNDSTSRPIKSGNEWRMPGDAVKRSQDFSDRLKKNLGLDDETTKKIFQAYLANTKPVDEISVQPISDKEKADRLKANRDAFNQTLKEIMTPAQFNKYLKIQHT